MACSRCSGFWPPAWAMSGRPPPLPPTMRGDRLDDFSRMVLLRQVLGDQAQEHRLAVRPAAEEDDPGAETVPQLVAEVPERLHIGGFHDGRQNGNPIDLTDASQQIAGILCRQLSFEGLDLLLQLPFALQELIRPFRRFQKTGPQKSRRLPEFVLQTPDIGHRPAPRHRLDPADAGRNGRFMDDLQKADISGPSARGSRRRAPG